MADIIATIENAVLARLLAGEAAIGYQWLTRETYPADWDAFLKEKSTVRDPGVWFGYAGGSVDTHQEMLAIGKGARVQLTFGITVISRHQGNEQARRHGTETQGQVGAYQLMLDCVSLLQWQSLGLDIMPLEFGALRLVRPAGALTQMKAAMYAAQVTTSFALPILPDDLGDGALDAFETFHSNWDIPPFGGIDAAPGTPGIQLPDDVNADATDNLELDQ